MRKRVSLTFAFALLLAIAPANLSSAQPSNDNLADASPVTELPFSDEVDVTDATVEDGEPTETCAPFANTVWYGVTLAGDTLVSVDTAGSDYDTTLALWTGTGFEDLDLVACNDDVDTLQARLTFAAEGGVTYWVQAGAFGGLEEGGGHLSIAFTEARRGGPPTIFKFSSRGHFADAEWFDDLPDGFRDTFVFLFDGREKVFRQRPFRASQVFVSIFEETFDEETGQFTFTDWSGSAALEPGEFAIDRRLRSAFVEADVTLFGFTCTESDFEDGEEGFGYHVECTELGTADVHVSVVWTGEGPVFTSMFMDRFRTQGVRFTFRSHSTGRGAEATGSITGDLNPELGSADFAFLARDAFAEMFWSRRNGGFFFG